MRDFPWRTALTIALVFVGQAIVSRGLPKAASIERPTTPRELPRAGDEKRSPAPQSTSALLDAMGLEHFYGALARTAKGDGVTRIVHYGDSPTTADLITGDVRHLLQARFGDAGHGFILIDKPWAWYQHDMVKLSGSGWQ